MANGGKLRVTRFRREAPSGPSWQKTSVNGKLKWGSLGCDRYMSQQNLGGRFLAMETITE